MLNLDHLLIGDPDLKLSGDGSSVPFYFVSIVSVCCCREASIEQFVPLLLHC